MPGWQFNVGWSVIETDNRIISLCIYVIVVVFCGKGKKNSNDETQPPANKYCFANDYSMIHIHTYGGVEKRKLTIFAIENVHQQALTVSELLLLLVFL
ncbi:hypothetical protein T03_12000 [Trichinella britovi]|uniref:Uncharacterized protein n=1 Tax=Trichinella britovi TaxID=45882 RepID=A0A0V1CVZ3_TRIBR|nr:hypothetical protein T03_12000 [Trichinella britovi]KRZ89600.1 hypothetical protein T08_1488 [Trichinella sp. T8]